MFPVHYPLLRAARIIFVQNSSACAGTRAIVTAKASAALFSAAPAMLKGLIIDEKLGLDQVDEQIRDFLCKKPANFVEEVVALFQVPHGCASPGRPPPARYTWASRGGNYQPPFAPRAGVGRRWLGVGRQEGVPPRHEDARAEPDKGPVRRAV